RRAARATPGRARLRGPGLGGEAHAAAVPLRLVERGVGEAEERLRLAAVIRTRRDAEARADVARRHHAADDLERVLVRRLGQEQRELVAADPERLVAAAERVVQRAREDLQRVVAGGMAEAVVQLLEAVEVADDERERAVVAQRACNLALEPLD